VIRSDETPRSSMAWMVVAVEDASPLVEVGILIFGVELLGAIEGRKPLGRRRQAPCGG
jgi:hypothetical protein